MSPATLRGEALGEWCDAHGWHEADVIALQVVAGQATVCRSFYDAGRDALVFVGWDGAEMVFERGWCSGHRATERTAA